MSVIAVVACACNVTHSGADKAKGCGRRWGLRVTTIAEGAVQLTPADDPELVDAADELRRVTPGQLDKLRSAAEKWIAGVTATYGLFGLTGIVVAKDSVSALPVWAQILAAVALATALVLAALSIHRAYRAAYGWPVIRDMRIDEQLRNWYTNHRAEPERVANSLHAAVRLSAAALAGLAVAVALIWFVPAEEPKSAPVRITRTDGSRVCGTVVGSQTLGTIRIRRAGNGDVVAVPAAEAARVEPVTAC